MFSNNSRKHLVHGMNHFLAYPEQQILLWKLRRKKIALNLPGIENVTDQIGRKISIGKLKVMKINYSFKNLSCQELISYVVLLSWLKCRSHRHRSRSRSPTERKRRHKSRSRSPSHRSHRKKKSKKSDKSKDDDSDWNTCNLWFAVTFPITDCNYTS